MSEFAPICIYLVISLLVSLILLFICILPNLLQKFNSYIKSQNPQELSRFLAKKIKYTIPLIMNFLLMSIGMPAIAVDSDGEEQTNSPFHEGSGTPQSQEAPPVAESSENLSTEVAPSLNSNPGEGGPVQERPPLSPGASANLKPPVLPGDDNSSSSASALKLPLPSTTSSPVPSISSRGASWIDEYFGPEVSSSAPDDQGPRQQEAVVQATQQASPSSSTDVGPTGEQLRGQVSSFLSSFSKRKQKPCFYSSTEEELGIAHASPEKLAKIAQTIGRLSDGPNRPNSAQNAKALLTMEVEEWAKANEGGH